VASDQSERQQESAKERSKRYSKISRSMNWSGAMLAQSSNVICRMISTRFVLAGATNAE
jgi:hypothetical protein